MRDPKPMRRPDGQTGFSMIEMLMTAFILAVGLLGLAMLQTMSIRAFRGSKSMTTAIQLAEGVMERVEQESRQSWLNLTDTNLSTAKTVTDLPNLRYLVIKDKGNLVETFNLKGGAVDTSSTDPLVKTTFYTVTTTRFAATAASTGLVSDLTVLVEFNDDRDQKNVAIPRKFTLSRRVLHG